MYLLDTNTCIQYLRNKNALVVQRINARRPDELRVCSIVVAELYYGCLCIAHLAPNHQRSLRDKAVAFEPGDQRAAAVTT